MGHGYYAIVAFGIIVKINDINQYLVDDDIYEYVYELQSSDEFVSLSFHFNSIDGGNIFITITKKEILQDTRGSNGRFAKIIIDELKPTEEEFKLLHKARAKLIGDKMEKVKFGLFTYEDE
jgi:hypothetical protein